MSTKKQKANQPVNTAKKAPKWGTDEWITAHPWSKMDKDRKRRVRKLLGLEGNPVTDQVIDNIKEGICFVRDALRARNMAIPKNAASEAKTAFETLRSFFTKAVNTVIAYDLSVKWGPSDAKSGKVSTAKTCSHKCSGKCKCNSHCNKTHAKGKKS